MDKSCVRRTVTINLGDYLLEGEYMVPTYTKFNLDRWLNIFSHIIIKISFEEYWSWLI